MRQLPKPVRIVIKTFTSLKLTVVLLSLALALTFFGTLAQVDKGLYVVQKDYFQSVGIVLHSQPIPKAEGGIWFNLTIPLVGGYLLGKLLLINLVAGFISRFKWTPKKSGIYISHLGLILLLVGQWFTEMFQVESNIRFEEGESRNYSEAFREFELAFTTPSADRNAKSHVAIPESKLSKVGEGKTFSDAAVPFDLKVLKRYANSTISTNFPSASRDNFEAAGRNFTPVEKDQVFSMDAINVPSYEIEFISKSDGQSVGKYLLTPELLPQKVASSAEPMDVQLRFTRYYKPFTLHLIDFRHDKFVGTETPRNFSSLVQVDHPETGENRSVNIRMNDPLRYNGEAYFQASFDRVNPRVTVLQVVRNPSAWIPYISCTMMTLGLLIQFLIHLEKFVGKQMARHSGASTPATKNKNSKKQAESKATA